MSTAKRTALAATLLSIFGLGLLNWGLWKISFLGLNQKQMLMLSAVPMMILAFWILETEPSLKRSENGPNE
jgi:hypothetical protein